MLDLTRLDSLLRPYRLELPDALTRQQSGDLLGRGTGSSVEYQDHRQYFMGDDVRLIDWRAFARSDRLTLKMYRQEISPRVDVIVDASASCGHDEPKRDLLLAMAASFALLAGRAHAKPRLWATGGMARPLRGVDELAELPFAAEIDLAGALRASGSLRARGVRIVVSDFLFEHDPRDLVALLGAGADRLVLVQVLSAFENAPQASGSVRLVDLDTGAPLDLALDESTIASYLRRLANLRAELARQARRAGGLFAAVDAAMSSGDALRRLAQDRILAVA